MPTNYPAGFDSFATRGALMSDTPTHDDVHQDIEDSIEAIQGALGLNPQGAAGTVAARLGRLDVVQPQATIVALTPVEGARAWSTDTRRLWVATNGEWRIVGGNIPRVSRRVTATNSLAFPNEVWTSIPMLTATVGVTGADFVVAGNLVVPPLAGGDYHLSFGATFRSGTTTDQNATDNNPDPRPTRNTYRALRCVITNNTSIGAEETQWIASVPHNNAADLTPTASLATDVRLEAGATLTFAGVHNLGASDQMILRAWFNLHMVAHAPALT